MRRICRQRSRSRLRQGGAGGVARRLERQAAIVTHIVLRLPGDFGQIMRKAVRPHAMLRQQQRRWQQPAQNEFGQTVHAEEYTRAKKCYSGNWNKPACRFVYRPTGRSRYSPNLKEAP